MTGELSGVQVAGAIVTLCTESNIEYYSDWPRESGEDPLTEVDLLSLQGIEKKQRGNEYKKHKVYDHDREKEESDKKVHEAMEIDCLKGGDKEYKEYKTQDPNNPKRETKRDQPESSFERELEKQSEKEVDPDELETIRKMTIEEEEVKGQDDRQEIKPPSANQQKKKG